MGPDGGQRLVEGHQPPCFSNHSSHCHSSALLLFPWGASSSSAGLLTVGIAGILVLLSCGGLGASCGPCHPEGCLVLRHMR